MKNNWTNWTLLQNTLYKYKFKNPNFTYKVYYYFLCPIYNIIKKNSLLVKKSSNIPLKLDIISCPIHVQLVQFQKEK